MNAPADRDRPAILPAAFHHPLHLLWIGVLPLTVLFLINCQAAWFAWDEISAAKQSFLRSSLTLTAMLPLLILGGVISRWLKNLPLTVWWHATLLVLNIAFVWVNLWCLGNAVPSPLAMPEWIFDYDTLFAAQFACAMPLCFYALVGIACVPLRVSFAKDIIVSVVLLVAPPVAWVLLIILLRLALVHGAARLWEIFPHELLRIGGLAFLIICGVTMMLGLLRLLTRFYLWLQRYDWALVTISALLMPLGGLVLNIGIPFPASFQTTGIYVWTLINAAVLLLGCAPRLKKIPALWLAQMFTFPFTLYFFIVFLPWLPLFLPAMVACGAGFLILTPTVLFMVHGQRLIAGFKNSAAIFGKPLTVTLGLAALLALPAWFALQAALDRAALRAGLDYVYLAEPEQRAPLTVSPARLTRTLEKLNNYQAGAYLPILSNFYNWSVFDNLFLPDGKLKEMYRAFSGKELPAADRDRMMARGIFSQSNRQQRGNVRRPLELPREQVTTAHTVTVSDDGDCIRATLALTVTNLAKAQNEYVAKLQLSPSVMVSGLRLVIDGEKVDGRLFEQKTALWVYHQIRDRQRRDPALLRYTADDEIELRVFPLEKKQTRKVEIDFLYPRKARASITFNDKNILPSNPEYLTPLTLTKFSDARAMLILTGPTHLKWLCERQPYWHFIIERSADTDQQTAAELLQKIRNINASWPMTNGKITLANFESKLMTPPLVMLASLDITQLEKMLGEFPARGGFLREKVLREETAAYEHAMRRDDPQSFLNFPQFAFILSGTTDAPPPSVAINYTPGEWRAVFLADGKKIHKFTDTRRTFILADGELEVYNNGKFEPVPPNTISVIENETYQKGAALFALQDELDRHPQRAGKLLPLLVQLSRESGIMAPATAYIVVERSAHWKILSAKEQQKLAANQALELEAEVVPEPAAWALLVTGAAGWLLFQFILNGTSRSRSRTPRSQG
ncbi:MAG: MSEP-CTERM sorting domain-containing protein [Verrucomicrobiales bacterium]|jgi:hypothetical protein|nr:MSEP-CTERM sorting domain-containing protein [Verrucomicrobiales bacterium]